MSNALPLPKNIFQNLQAIRVPVLLKNLSITFSENIMTKGLSFFTILILTRQLGPDAYGKYSFIFVMVATCSALFDFGMENTAVRFSARDKGLQANIFGLYLSVKLSILFLLMLFFAFGGPWLFGLMHKSAVLPYLPFLMIGLLGESLFFVNDTYLQATQRFGLRAIINISRFSMALLLIGLLWKSPGFFTHAFAGLHFPLMMGASKETFLNAVVYIFCVPLLFSTLFFKKYISFLAAFVQNKIQKPLFNEMVRYERWMMVYSLTFNLMGRIDFLMLGFWVSFHMLGIYNAAFQFCSIFSFLPLALGKVLLPALSELDKSSIVLKTNRLVKLMYRLCLGAILMIPLTPWILPLLLGKAYNAAIPILEILLFAAIVSLMSMPYEQALYALGRPKVLSVGRCIQLITVVVLNLILLYICPSPYRIYIVAWTTLFGRLFYLVLSHRFYRMYEREEHV